MIIKPKRFVGLHAHTSFSIYDCVGFPDEHIDFVLENGMDAWAMTDHGNMNGFVHAWLKQKELRDQGRQFKLIPGCEMYVHPDLSEWRHAKAEADERKKQAKTRAASAEGNEGVEDEDASKTNKFLDPVKRRHHLVVLAKNSIGLQNLFTLVSRGYKEGFYRFPRIDYRMLKEHGEGLVVSTACVAGVAAYDALACFPDVPWDEIDSGLEIGKERFEQVQSAIGNTHDKLVDAVGDENVFLELQFNALGAQHLVNEHLMHYANEHNAQLIATADSHYCRPDYWQSREIYKKLGWMNYKDYDPSLIPQSKDDLKCELYPKNAEQMWESYQTYRGNRPFYDDQVIADAIERTHDVAHRLLDDADPDTSVKLPSFVVPQDKTEFEELVDLSKEGLKRLGLHNSDEHVERMKYELTIIKEKEFTRYFLTMKAVMDVAREHMLIGAARGSSGGSLVCYCLGITQIDPLKYDLMFERFISRHRQGFPDIDSDVSDRDKLLELLRERFGEDNVIPISNFNTLKLNSLVRDLSRFYGIEFSEVNRMMKQAEGETRKKVLVKGVDKNTFEMTYDMAMEHSEVFREFMENNPDFEKHIRVLLKQNKAIGRHAGGVIICDEILNRMPVIKIRGEMQTPWTEGLHNKHLPELGWIKIDLLGLETLRIIERCIELILKSEGIKEPTFAQINDWYQKHLHPSVIDFDDQCVWKYVYQQGHWGGIFQMTSEGAKRLTMKAKPQSLIDLAAITSIYRPGPMAANVDKKYVKAKRDPDSIEYAHHLVKDVLSETYGMLVFQEQITRLGAHVANMNERDCDRMRKAFTKKSISGLEKRKKEVKELGELFVEGAVKNGLDRDKATEIYQWIQYTSGYSFNKIHSLGYSIDSYWCAWLMTYYRSEWLCAYIESQIGNPKKRANAISELQSFGYSIAGVDINRSGKSWSIPKGSSEFIPSFKTLKGVGDAAIDEIMLKRPYSTIHDLLWDDDGKWKHGKANKRVFSTLIKVGAFDSMDLIGDDKVFTSYKHMHEVIVEHWNEIKHAKKGRARFEELLIETRDMPGWSTREFIESKMELMGQFDVGLIIDDAVQKKLDELKVRSMDDHDGKKDLYWFVLVSAERKTTRNHRPYQLLKVAGHSGEQHKMFLWGTKDDTCLIKYAPYLAEVSQSDFGFASSLSKLRQLDSKRKCAA